MEVGGEGRILNYLSIIEFLFWLWALLASRLSGLIWSNSFLSLFLLLPSAFIYFFVPIIFIPHTSSFFVRFLILSRPIHMSHTLLCLVYFSFTFLMLQTEMEEDPQNKENKVKRNWWLPHYPDWYTPSPDLCDWMNSRIYFLKRHGIR